MCSNIQIIFWFRAPKEFSCLVVAFGCVHCRLFIHSVGEYVTCYFVLLRFLVMFGRVDILKISSRAAHPNNYYLFYYFILSKQKFSWNCAPVVFSPPDSSASRLRLLIEVWLWYGAQRADRQLLRSTSEKTTCPKGRILLWSQSSSLSAPFCQPPTAVGSLL